MAYPEPESADCRKSTAERPLPTDSGVILIAMLWILTALAVIAISFARESRVEVAAARNAQALEASYFIARAGIEATTYQILRKYLTPAVQRTAVQTEPDPIDLGRVAGDFAGGSYQVEIQDESGKLNINIVSEQQLTALIQAAGIAEPDAGIIKDSILDWKDADDAHRFNGAEDDYYQGLNPPYRAKNRRIDAIEELLLVRGITRDYFFGKPERAADGSITYRYGLARLLTVHATPDQININHAPLPVLLSIPGMPADAAQLIYERRKTKPFKDIEELRQEIPIAINDNTRRSLTTRQTGVLTLTAVARTRDSKARRIVRAIIRLTPRAGAPYQTLYWNENVSDYEGIAP